ncbi:hypothetical protein J31TS4_22410 [Paenibacillus sp. J31TS4]|uniref:extracellular solute-binding protein n=1 Tax=Paenibacillus sp. J31TS4 TaxID=2807195 RepID=UPI001B11D0A5|nr:extracellular solute-binding protein [Paenibacillus sp. J31TS4]GIP38961.1 hypothetical protein J31TS4_22410 [Paenibacillus sp. J31TS4]
MEAGNKGRGNEKQSRKTFRRRLDDMIRTLRGEILTGQRRDGEFLPSERELAVHFQLSNKLVRAGLEELVAEGLIQKLPRVGNRVQVPPSGQPVRIRFGYHSTLESDVEMERLLDGFHAAHPGIRVQPLPISFHNYHETVTEYMEAGLLDVVTMNYNNYERFRSQGSLAMLEPLEPDERIFPFLSEAFRQEGAAYARPFVFSPLILCYNLDHLAEKKVRWPREPMEWHTLIRLASRLTVENERFGFYFFLLSINRWPVFLLQNGMRWDGSADGAAEAVERIVEGLKLCRSMIYARDTFPTYLSGSDADAEELFREGKVSVIMTSYFALNRLRGSGVRFDVAPLPGGREDKTILMTIGLAVNGRSEEKVASRTLVDYLVSDRTQAEIGQLTFSLPAVREAAESESPGHPERPPHFRMFEERTDTFRLITELNLSLAQLEAVMKEARLYWAKLLSEQALKRRLAELLLAR